MLFQVSHSCESLLTVFACKRSLSSVNQMMRSKCLSISKSTPTFNTNKRFFACMTSHMTSNLSSLIKSFTTFRTHIRTLSYISNLKKIFVYGKGRNYKRHFICFKFTCVGSQMIFVMRLGNESLATFFTLKRFSSILTKLMIFYVSFRFKFFIANIALEHSWIA